MFIYAQLLFSRTCWVLSWIFPNRRKEETATWRPSGRNTRVFTDDQKLSQWKKSGGIYTPWPSSSITSFPILVHLITSPLKVYLVFSPWWRLPRDPEVKWRLRHASYLAPTIFTPLVPQHRVFLVTPKVTGTSEVGRPLAHSPSIPDRRILSSADLHHCLWVTFAGHRRSGVSKPAQKQ